MSSADAYLTRAGRVLGYKRGVGQVYRLAGRSQTVLGSHALAEAMKEHSAPTSIHWGIGTAAGAVAGGLIGAKYGHWVVGAISGGSVFTNAPALLSAGTRKEAFWNLVQTHGGVLASLAMKNNSFLGFLIGYIAVGFAREYYGGDT